MAGNIGGVISYSNLPPGTTPARSKSNPFRGVRKGHVDSMLHPLSLVWPTFAVQTDLFDDGGRRVARTTQLGR